MFFNSPREGPRASSLFEWKLNLVESHMASSIDKLAGKQSGGLNEKSGMQSVYQLPCNQAKVYQLRFEQQQPTIWAWWTLMKAKTELALKSWKPTFLSLEPYFQAFKKKWTCHVSYTIRALDLIPSLRPMPKYQLSSATKCPDELPLYLNEPIFLS